MASLINASPGILRGNKGTTLEGGMREPTVLRGEAKTPHEKFFYHGGNTLRAVRSGKWKLHWNKRKPTQLFNLETDIVEKKNLIKANPEVVKRLVGYLKAFEKDIAENNRPAGFVENPKPLSK